MHIICPVAMPSKHISNSIFPLLYASDLRCYGRGILVFFVGAYTDHLGNGDGDDTGSIKGEATGERDRYTILSELCMKGSKPPGISPARCKYHARATRGGHL